MPVLSKKEGITYLLIFRDQEKKRKKCPSRIPFECITGAHKKTPTYPKSNTILVDKDGL